MKRGHSYNSFYDHEKPNHPLVKALHDKGYKGFFLIYASHWATDAGWVIEGVISDWLGYTISSSLEKIKGYKEIK